MRYGSIRLSNSSLGTLYSNLVRISGKMGNIQAHKGRISEQ